jgi:hypothetical protein
MFICTFGKFTSKAAIIAIVEEQTNAAELDSPDPIMKTKKKKEEEEKKCDPDLTSVCK